VGIHQNFSQDIRFFTFLSFFFGVWFICVSA